MKIKAFFYRSFLLIIYFSILFFLPFTDYFPEADLRVNVVYLVIDLFFAVFLLFIFVSSKIELGLVDLVLLFFLFFVCFDSIVSWKLPLFTSRAYFLLQMLPVYIVSKGIAKAPAHLKAIFIAIACSFLVELSIAIVQYFNFSGNERPGLQLTGTFENSGLLSIYLVTVSPFALDTISGLCKVKWTRWAALIAVNAMLLFILIATGSRIAIIIQLSFYFFLLARALFQRGSSRRRGLLFMGSSAGIASLFIFWLLSMTKQDSSDGRKLIWKITAGNIHPGRIIAGTGYGSFPIEYPYWQGQYFAGAVQDAREALLADFTRTAFNEYLQTFVESGLIGSIVLLLMIFAVFSRYKTWFSDRQYFPVAFSVLSIFLSAGFYYSFHCAPLFVLLIILSAVLSPHSSGMRVIRMNNLLSRACVGLLFIFFLVLSFQDLCDCIHVRAWEEANVRGYQLDRGASDVYERQAGYFNNNGVFLCNYGEYLYATGEYEKAAGVLLRAALLYPNERSLLYLGEAYLKNGEPAKAVGVFKTLNDIVPNRFSPKYQLFALYRNAQDSVTASYYARMILALPVKIPSGYVDGVKDVARAYLK